MVFETEDTLSAIEQAFENSKAARFQAKLQWESAKGRYHMELVAKREAGATWTQTDMKAMEAASLDSVDYVKEAYLSFIAADTDYRKKKVAWESAKRNYWDNKENRYVSGK